MEPIIYLRRKMPFMQKTKQKPFLHWLKKNEQNWHHWTARLRMGSRPHTYWKQCGYYPSLCPMRTVQLLAINTLLHIFWKTAEVFFPLTIWIHKEIPNIYRYFTTDLACHTEVGLQLLCQRLLSLVRHWNIIDESGKQRQFSPNLRFQKEKWSLVR